MPCTDCDRKPLLTKQTAPAPTGLTRCQVHPQKHAPLCKDCCISKHKGLRCTWFEVCW
ncbi:MAG TPA: hypothetical protein VJB16_06615 [archaeon]|nr:hypothetical protein [archaeon]